MSTDQPVLQPLSLAPQSPGGATASDRVPPSGDGVTTPAHDIPCLFCDKCYSIPGEMDSLLRHLLLTHKLVIADIKLVADVKTYFDHWRQRFKEAPMTEFCTVIQTNSKETDIEPKELYYLLCDVLPEDKKLRVQLQQQKLDVVLSQQQQERDDSSFSRTCLFCKEHFSGNRADLFNHMAHEHNFNVGQPDNLVFTNEFLDLLEEKLKSLRCLYCEKIFKDRHVLKEHMRKKLHKKIDPKNKTYDRFYIINYLELGKNWETLAAETDDVCDVSGVDTGDDSDTNSLLDEWSDWVDDAGASVVCLYCDTTASTVDKILHHMKDIHHFDLVQIKDEKKMSFYQEVKLINFIRRQVHQCTCPICHDQFEQRDGLLAHMNFLGHVSLVPDQTAWDQPQYFFPTYENDALLCGLDDPEADTRGTDQSDKASVCTSDSGVVIAEDCTVERDSILSQQGVRDQLLS